MDLCPVMTTLGANRTTWVLRVVLGLVLLTAGARAQVFISEFMASNSTGLKDEDGAASDWIEIYNAGSAVVDLGGWYLTDDPDLLTKWQFPPTPLGAHRFLVVFASDKDRRVSGAPLHTNFKLSAEGEYLALVGRDGATRVCEFAPAFPPQYPDVSWGTGVTTTLLAADAPARVRIPTDGALGTAWVAPEFADAGWQAGTNGVGYETVVSGFAVRVVKANVYVSDLATAERVLSTPSLQAAVYGETAPVINYVNSGSGGNYGDDRAVPGLVGDVEDYVIEATGTVTLPKSGNWTFGVHSDDGFRLEVGDKVLEHPDPRGPDATMATFNFSKAGEHALRLVFYERGGGSEVELWAASGWRWRWTANDFDLVGDTAAGGLAVVSTPVSGGGGAGYRRDIRTDVEALMVNRQVSAYVRLPFVVEEAGALESLTLKIKYDDGFAAYLNGELVATRNAPAAPAWSTPATAAHAALDYEWIDLSSRLAALRSGTNLLALHAMNRTAGDSAFLVLAGLSEYRVGGGVYAHLSPGTPGMANVSGVAGIAEPVQFSVRGGVYTNTFTVTLLTATPGATIRYTVNNQLPTESSTLYTGPISVTQSRAIRARAFVAGMLPSAPATEVYTLLDTGLHAFSSPLPLVIIDAYGQALQPDMAERAAATITVIDTHRPSHRATLLSRPDYHGRAGIEGRGQTSWGFPKKPYNVELRDEWDEDRDASLLGMPADSDWVLLNLYNDKTFLNDFLAHELFEQMGHYAVRRRHVEVFLNGTRPDGGSDTSGRVNNDDYVGVYLLLERIKIGKDRVDIARLDPADSQEPAISGGYIFKKDKDSPNDVSFTTSYGQYLKYHDPRGDDLTTAQRAWLENHLNQFEAALYGAAWKSPSTGYPRYIDIDSFADNHWIVEFTKQIDGYRLSNYLQKDRGGKIRMEPIWDWNLSFGNADYLEGQYAASWYWPLISGGDHLWLRRLISEPGDPDFNQRLTDRWSVLRTNVLDAERIVRRIDELAALLDPAQARDFSRWPRLGSYVWPNPPGLANAGTYAEVLDWVKTWLRDRYVWIDSQFLAVPVPSLPEGLIQPGASLALSAPQGRIYYRLDGRDPRLSGGSVASGSFTYLVPMTLSGNVRLFARAYDSGRWSGPAVRSYYTEIPRLAVTEIQYHPAPASAGSPYAADDFQFIELANLGTATLNLAGYTLGGGVDFRFAGGVLVPGERVVLVRNRDAFIARYGTEIAIGGVFARSLAHSGERLVLVGPLAEPILDFEYDDSWEPITDGYGFSLVAADEQAPLGAWGDPGQWRRSGRLGGSPGAADPLVLIAPIVINEVMTHTAAPDVDAIELYNPTGEAVDIGCWNLTDDRDVPAKYRIPAGTTVPPGGYLVLDATQFGSSQGAEPGFGLSALGEEVFLFSADAAGQITGHRDGFEFGAAGLGDTFGRHTNSVGDVQFPIQRRSTLGSANAGPRSGAVVINEIRYLPADGDEEFIELKNITDQPVKLYDPLVPAHTWRLEGVGYDFPPNIEMAPCSLLLLVGVDPASFRVRHSIPAGVLVLGPYAGALDGGGEALVLVRPGAPVLGPDGGFVVPEVAVDRVRYDDEAPWPAEAAGWGPSLERIIAAGYGDDPAQWRPSAGRGSPGLDNPAQPGQGAPSIDAAEWADGPEPVFRLWLTPIAGQACRIESRDAMSGGAWSVLALIPAQETTCPVTVADPAFTGRHERYYRVVVP
ncbi:MAG TPA: CotH kinase family protein [Verrucomicrobiota bacterium]|nr:CotH kinase family protein [Verrucomicrobiota bacterium]